MTPPVNRVYIMRFRERAVWRGCLERTVCETRLAVSLAGELGAQGLLFLAADGPGDRAPHAVRVDAGTVVQELQQRAPGIAILQPFVATFWAARQEGNVGIHGSVLAAGAYAAPGHRFVGPRCKWA
jgi:hypothetical protein